MRVGRLALYGRCPSAIRKLVDLLRYLILAPLSRIIEVPEALMGKSLGILEVLATVLWGRVCEWGDTGHSGVRRLQLLGGMGGSPWS